MIDMTMSFIKDSCCVYDLECCYRQVQAATFDLLLSFVPHRGVFIVVLAVCVACWVTITTRFFATAKTSRFETHNPKSLTQP